MTDRVGKALARMAPGLRRYTQGGKSEPYIEYARLRECLPFPDESEDSIRLMSRLVNIHAPDKWYGHSISSDKVWPAVVHATGMMGLDPRMNNGFRQLPTAKRGTKPKTRSKKVRGFSHFLLHLDNT